MALRRKLRAIQYPAATTFDPSDISALRHLVVWLEDNKIRQWKIDERKELRDVESNDWLSALSKYLDELECPRPYKAWDSDASQRIGVLDWLCGMAVGYEYEDNAETFTTFGESLGSTTSQPLEIDVTTPEFQEGIKHLAQLLQIPLQTDLALTTRAITALVNRKFTNAAVTSHQLAGTPKDYFRLDSTPLGLDTEDPVLNRGARILRLLHVADLRELQTKVNEIISEIQAITADPKTDSRLGRVGK